MHSSEQRHLGGDWASRLVRLALGAHGPDALLERLRTAFFRFTVLTGLLIVPMLTGGAAVGTGPRVAAGLAVAVVLVWWGRCRRAGRFPSWSPLVETPLLLVVGIGLDDPMMALGLLYTGMYFRTLFGSSRQAAGVVVAFLAAHLGAVAIAEALGRTVVPLLHPGVAQQPMGFSFAAVVMHTLLVTLEQRRRDARRQQALADVAASLAAAESVAEVATLAGEGAAHVVSPVSRRVLVAFDTGTGLRVVSSTDAGLHGLEVAVDVEDQRRLVAGEVLPLDAAAALDGTRDWADAAVAGIVVHGSLFGVVAVVGWPCTEPLPLVTLASHVGLALGRALSLEATRGSEAKFRSLIANAADCIRVIDAAGTIVFESDAVRAVFGHDADQLVGHSAFELMHPDDVAAMQTLVAGLEGTPGATSFGECRLAHADGTWRFAEGTVRNLLHDPAIGGMVINYRDVTQRKKLENLLRHQALHDPLTGLGNRQLFYDRVEHALELDQRTGHGVAVFFFDLDAFKQVNDTLGHRVGDAVLLTTARRIHGAIRAADTVARLGGDEFAVLLEGVQDIAAVHALAETILAAVREPIAALGEIVTIDASMGIVVRKDERSSEELLHNADLAMYRAKGLGKGRCEVFEIGMKERLRERAELTADMERGIAAGEFVPYYQPIVDLPSGDTVGVEALVRWQHPERGVLPPSAFLPIAEETGLVVRIGRQLLHTACSDVVGWQQQDGSALEVSVNLCAAELADPQLVDHVRQVLAETGLDASLLVIEITESMLLQDVQATAATLEQLTALGVKVALDDFGTGYSSLTYLERFPVSVVKIDKSFVDRMGQPDESAVANAVITIGRTLGLRVTAEGVEEETQVARLQSMGCDFAQGYYYARPLPAADLSPLVARPAQRLLTV